MMNNQKDRPKTAHGIFARFSGKVVILTGGAVILFVAVFSFAMSATSSTKFCLSCHEMQTYKEELKFSTHVKDEDGKDIECSQCHLPRGIGPKFFAAKSYSGIKDLYVHFIDQPQELDRKDLQVTARRFVDDASCLKCHDDLYKNAKGDAVISDIGKVSHDAYYGKDGVSYRNCVACHVNIAHLPKFDSRLDINQEFAGRLERKEAYQ